LELLLSENKHFVTGMATSGKTMMSVHILFAIAECAAANPDLGIAVVIGFIGERGGDIRLYKDFQHDFPEVPTELYAAEYGKHNNDIYIDVGCFTLNRAIRLMLTGKQVVLNFDSFSRLVAYWSEYSKADPKDSLLSGGAKRGSIFKFGPTIATWQGIWPDGNGGWLSLTQMGTVLAAGGRNDPAEALYAKESMHSASTSITELTAVGPNDPRPSFHFGGTFSRAPVTPRRGGGTRSYDPRPPAHKRQSEMVGKYIQHGLTWDPGVYSIYLKRLLDYAENNPPYTVLPEFPPNLGAVEWRVKELADRYRADPDEFKEWGIRAWAATKDRNPLKLGMEKMEKSKGGWVHESIALPTFDDGLRAQKYLEPIEGWKTQGYIWEQAIKLKLDPYFLEYSVICWWIKVMTRINELRGLKLGRPIYQNEEYGDRSKQFNEIPFRKLPYVG
jgi:hypothetical protein